MAYGTDPRRVLELLNAVGTAHPDVLETPEPAVFFRGFGASSLDFSLRVWTGDFENWWRVSSEVTVAVNDAIKEAGIEIPFHRGTSTSARSTRTRLEKRSKRQWPGAMARGASNAATRAGNFAAFLLII